MYQSGWERDISRRHTVTLCPQLSTILLSGLRFHCEILRSCILEMNRVFVFWLFFFPLYTCSCYQDMREIREETAFTMLEAKGHIARENGYAVCHVAMTNYLDLVFRGVLRTLFTLYFRLHPATWHFS